MKLESGDYVEKQLEKDKLLMEVKAENNMPLWLSNLLSEYKIYRTSYSKYGKEYEALLLNDRKLKDINQLQLLRVNKEYKEAKQLIIV